MDRPATSRVLFGCTDDGTIVSWDVSAARYTAKRLYRERARGLRGGRHNASTQNLGHILPSQSPGDRPGSRPTSRTDSRSSAKGDPHSASFFTTELGHDPVYSDSSEDEDPDRHSRHRTTAPRRRRSRPRNRTATAGTLESHSWDSSYSDAHGRLNVVLDSKIDGLDVVAISDIIDEEESEDLPSKACWRGHMDSVCGAVTIKDHNCLVTVAHDGFFRAWNSDGECNGEMQVCVSQSEASVPMLIAFSIPYIFWLYYTIQYTN